MNRWMGFCMSFMFFGVLLVYVQDSWVFGMIIIGDGLFVGVQVLLLGIFNGIVIDEYGNY